MRTVAKICELPNVRGRRWLTHRDDSVNWTLVIERAAWTITGIGAAPRVAPRVMRGHWQSAKCPPRIPFSRQIGRVMIVCFVSLIIMSVSAGICAAIVAINKCRLPRGRQAGNVGVWLSGRRGRVCSCFNRDQVLN